MTPQITIIALALIAAVLAVIAALQRIHINNLNAENDGERARHEVTNELLTEARNEAKNEYDLRRQAEKNLAEANDEVDTWRARAMRAENALGSVKVTRDPKTGRMVSTKAKSRPTAKEMEKGLAAFDAMMGNAIEQLQGLTVRKMPDDMQTESALNMGRTLRLCDEVEKNATTGL